MSLTWCESPAEKKIKALFMIFVSAAKQFWNRSIGPDKLKHPAWKYGRYCGATRTNSELMCCFSLTSLVGISTLKELNCNVLGCIQLLGKWMLFAYFCSDVPTEFFQSAGKNNIGVRSIESTVTQNFAGWVVRDFSNAADAELASGYLVYQWKRRGRQGLLLMTIH